MYVKINRDVCPAQLIFCEHCLGQFLLRPKGCERRCFEEIMDDGKEELTIDLHTGIHDVQFVLDEDQRELMAVEGWRYFVDFPVPIYRNSLMSEES